jgi:hypothetical protein
MIIRLLCFSLLCLTLSHTCFSDIIEEKPETIEGANFELLWDSTLSPHVGSAFLLSLTEGYDFWGSHATSTTADESHFLMRTVGSGLDLFLTFHSTLVQHEIFGHGARLREFEAKNREYGIGLFRGWAGGKYEKTNQKTMIVSMGGIEGADIMGHNIDLRWLNSSVITPVKAWNYIFSSGNQSFYIHMFRDLDSPGHDIASYIEDINEYYSNSHSIDIAKIRDLGLLDYLNPYWYFSFYCIGQYVANGVSTFRYPMISLTDNLEYLPAMRLVLTPYGPEGQFVNYLKYKDFSGKITFNYGKTNNKKSYAFGLHSNPFLLGNYLLLGSQVALWSQPEITLEDSPKHNSNKIGFLINLKPAIRVKNNFHINFHLGYKRKGFVQGEKIAGHFITRVGLRVIL